MLELVGSGGFGEVYRARDTRLDRIVAIKILPQAFAVDAERRERFRREAIAASALNHPHICTVHELVETDGHFLIVMELVEGETLHAALAKGPLAIAEALPIAIQIADALGEAHRAGILHRDVKCRNIALTKRGQVKVLDFGLAKLLGAEGQEEGQTLEKLTADGTSPGTPGYMSPEQLLARPLDRRSDLFSFGVVLYRMVTGRLPFEGTSTVAMADAILHAEPRDFGEGAIPEKLKAIVRRLLQKDPEKRYASAEEVEADLKALEAELSPARRAGLSRTAWAAVAAGLVVVVSVGGWYAHRWSRQKWALEATAEIAQLVEAEEFPKAVAMIREARAILPKDATLEKLWLKATGFVSMETVPPGADVSIRPYKGDPNAWESVGRSPLVEVRVPQGSYVLRVTRPGFAPMYLLDYNMMMFSLELVAEGAVPPGMVVVPGGDIRLGYPLEGAPVVHLESFFIDRHEVTNEEYGKFVEVGGYEKRDFWKQPFAREGRTIPWEEAVARFRDTTGRPGPATWEAGCCPKGLEKHPVAGVSWYEAAAYAEFAGKSLPTVYHWIWASHPDTYSMTVPGSNFRGAGTRPVGGPLTMSGFGTTDMAGNVKEWCWNEKGEGERFVLGGGFGEPSYMFTGADAQSPWDRGPAFGFRCAKIPSPPPAAASARLEPVFRDFTKEKPVSDEVFKAFQGLYEYDRGALNARIEKTLTSGDWTWEQVSIDAAYGGERMIVHLFLPRSSAPPFQTVVTFPGINAVFEERFDSEWIDWMGFLPKGGRALVFPIYKSTFERRDGWRPSGKQLASHRDHLIMWSKDLGRTLDYLETRRDVDGTKVAYFGNSWGASIGPVLLAVDHRFKAAILLAGGLKFRPSLPEADALNFAPHVTTPVLMLNGRYDNYAPLELSQLPLVRLLGVTNKDVRHVVSDSGHGVPQRDVVRESLTWLDKYLGPVKKQEAPAQ